jgi:hypothetical protein
MAPRPWPSPSGLPAGCAEHDRPMRGAGIGRFLVKPKMRPGVAAVPLPRLTAPPGALSQSALSSTNVLSKQDGAELPEGGGVSVNESGQWTSRFIQVCSA